MHPRRPWLALGAIVSLGAAAFVWWRWWPPASERPVEPDSTPVVATIAGDGPAGFRDGDRPRFGEPFGVAPAPDGSIYVTDGLAQRIRRIAPDGTVSTVAGGDRGYVDGPVASARFDTPSGIAVGGDGLVYVADTANDAVRRITPGGLVSTVVRAPELRGPVGIAVDRAGRVIVADTYNDRIRVIEKNGAIRTIAGVGQPGAVDGPAAAARFHTPCGVAVDAAGNVYVADAGNGAVRVVSPAGIVSTITPLPPYGISRPVAVAVAADGVVYVGENGVRLLEITPGRRVRVLAGSRPGFADGPGAEARFRGLAGLAVDDAGRLIASDSRNAAVRLVAAPARLGPRRPLAPPERPRFDAEAFAWQPLLWPVAPMDGPFEITGTFGELRGGFGTERLHAGVDVRAPEGTPVQAVREGVLLDPVGVLDYNTLNESIRIGPLAYVHLRVGRTHREAGAIDPARFPATYDEVGRLVLVRARRGARVLAGETIGTTNAFNHVHLNVGWTGEEVNPLRFRLPHFRDTRPPTIPRGGIRLLRDDGSPITERRKGRLLVGGLVQVIVDAWDQVDGNERGRRLGLYRLGYQVLEPDGSPAPGFETMRETIVFARAGAPDAGATVYASGSGIPYFGRRSTRFLYNVTNRLHEGIASVGRWDAGALPPGNYTLRVLAADISGNDATANRDLPVTVVPPS